MERTSWKDLDAKTKIAYSTACIAFVIGWGLTIAGFFVPPAGAISESVLWVLGQALLYAASVFGVGMYTTGAVRNMRREINDYMRHPKEYDASDTNIDTQEF
ncbi:MAG: hypothetical protein J6S67_06965 [Methanobrevibacter sp.]|nr:hypothetical protein [Bacteroidales bacterium]MBO7732273.1 hypothetical protein [Methanobrevibacter sp.]